MIMTVDCGVVELSSLRIYSQMDRMRQTWSSLSTLSKKNGTFKEEKKKTELDLGGHGPLPLPRLLELIAVERQ